MGLGLRGWTGFAGLGQVRVNGPRVLGLGYWVKELGLNNGLGSGLVTSRVNPIELAGH